MVRPAGQGLYLPAKVKMTATLEFSALQVRPGLPRDEPKHHKLERLFRSSTIMSVVLLVHYSPAGILFWYRFTKGDVLNSKA